jgi:hypothetical protein
MVKVSFERVTDDPLRLIDMDALAELVSALAVGAISQRVERGEDVNDAAFAPYSERYADAKTRMGRDDDPVDLTLTGKGGLMASVGVQARDISGPTAALTIAPDTASSERIKPPPKRGRRGKPRGVRVAGKAAPPHATVGAYHQEGRGNNPRREWLGLSPRDLEDINEQLRTVHRTTVLGALGVDIE